MMMMMMMMMIMIMLIMIIAFTEFVTASPCLLKIKAGVEV